MVRLCLGALGATLAIQQILYWLAAAEVPQGSATLDLALTEHARLVASLSDPPPGGAKVVVLGDSTVVSYAIGRTVPDRLYQTLRASLGRPVRVDNLAALGMSTFEYYPLARRIAAARHDAAVLAFNFQWLSDRWRDGMARPEMLALLRPRQLPQAIAAPLYWWNITLDRLLQYVTLWQLGAAEPWHAYRSEQVHTGNGLSALRAALQKRWQGMPDDAKVTGMPGAPSSLAKGRPDRLGAELLRQLYGPALHGVAADHPVLQLLAATLDEFADQNVPVLLYVTPANVDWMRAVGVFDERGLTQTVRTLQAICDAHGAMMLDLHALLPDAGFRDAGGHFVADDKRDGPLLVAQQLAPAVRNLLSRTNTPADAVQ